MVSKASPTVSMASPDYAFFLAKLKKMLLKGERTEYCIQAMRRESMWSELDPEQLVQLSGLAQMAGEIELGLRMLEKAHEIYPDHEQAWLEHLNVLRLLDRRKEYIALRARAGENGIDNLPSAEAENPSAEPGPADVDDQCLDPFVQNREKQELLELFMDLFQGRRDCFARQWADKKNQKQGYVPVRRPMSKNDVDEHLRGIKTYGIYLLGEDSNVRVAVLDADVNKKIRGKGLSPADKGGIKRERDYMHRRILELSRRDFGPEPLKEFSGGKGYHFWFFFAQPISAATARKSLQGVASQISGDLEFFNLEVFPKQDRLKGKGFGNLVKLPLGVHRLTGRPSYFNVANRGDPWKDMSCLRQVKRIKAEDLQKVLGRARAGKVSVHPREESWAAKYPELHELGVKCPLLGGIFVRARQGQELSLREEKIVLQTVGFLRRPQTLIHALFCRAAEYNPHLVDYKLSRLRGKPLGCKKIHQLLNSSRDFCEFESFAPYPHPLLHCPKYMARDDGSLEGEKAESLKQALDGLRKSLDTVQVFLDKNS